MKRATQSLLLLSLATPVVHAHEGLSLDTVTHALLHLADPLTALACAGVGLALYLGKRLRDHTR